ncbi:MAG: hypothetical protein WD021_06890 [Rhodothermales bacterium]
MPEAFGRVRAVLADTGYYSGDNVKACVEAGITPYIATKRQKHRLPATSQTESQDRKGKREW